VKKSNDGRKVPGDSSTKLTGINVKGNVQSNLNMFRKKKTKEKKPAAANGKKPDNAKIEKDGTGATVPTAESNNASADNSNSGITISSSIIPEATSSASIPATPGPPSNLNAQDSSKLDFGFLPDSPSGSKMQNDEEAKEPKVGSGKPAVEDSTKKKAKKNAKKDRKKAPRPLLMTKEQKCQVNEWDVMELCFQRKTYILECLSLGEMVDEKDLAELMDDIRTFLVNVHAAAETTLELKRIIEHPSIGDMYYILSIYRHGAFVIPKLILYLLSWKFMF